MAHSTRFFIKRELERMDNKLQWSYSHGNAVLQKCLEFAQRADQHGKSIDDTIAAAGDGMANALEAISTLREVIARLNEMF